VSHWCSRPNVLLKIADRLDPANKQREFVEGGTCLCLFMLQDACADFKLCTHTTGHSKGRADCKKQDDVLARLFDAQGNAQYDGECVKVLFGIGRTRYAGVAGRPWTISRSPSYAAIR